MSSPVPLYSFVPVMLVADTVCKEHAGHEDARGQNSDRAMVRLRSWQVQVRHTR